MPIKTEVKTKKHKLRAFFAALFGIIAVYLVLASVTVVWLNRTLTNTGTYTDTVAPLIKKPAIQNFIVQKVTDAVLSSSSVQSLAPDLLPASQLYGLQTANSLEAIVKPVVTANVLQIVKSPSFATVWKNANETTHAELISQLNSNGNQLTLNFSGAVNGVMLELKTTQLGILVSHTTLSPNDGNLTVKSNIFKQIHHYYNLFKDGTIAIIILTVLALILSVWLSVDHAKTLRRILFGVGILALLQALVLEIPSLVKLPGSDKPTQAAAEAVIEALVHNLQVASLVLGLVCVMAAISSKLYVKYHH